MWEIEKDAKCSDAPQEKHIKARNFIPFLSLVDGEGNEAVDKSMDM